MTRRLHNWTYRDVTDFLKENKFSFFEELKGSHQSWAKFGKDGEPETLVELNFRHDSYPVRTLKEIIRQSGIPEKAWIEWAGS